MLLLINTQPVVAMTAWSERISGGTRTVDNHEGASSQC
jgi:hypothetical protein